MKTLPAIRIFKEHIAKLSRADIMTFTSEALSYYEEPIITHG
jgi:hypothetical protein